MRLPLLAMSAACQARSERGYRILDMKPGAFE